VSRTEVADLVVKSAKIYTVEIDHPWAQAVAVKDDKIIAVGRDSDIEQYIGNGTSVVDAKGRLLLPGFIDSHTHFAPGAAGLDQVFLNTATSLEEAQQRIKAYADNHPDKEWIIGRGFGYIYFPNQRLPRKEDIDVVVPDRPAYFKSFDGHSVWANSKALELAGITKDSVYDGYGEIIKDSETGEPTGCFTERSQDLIIGLPKTTYEDRLDALRMGMRYASSLGVTSVHVCIGFGVTPEDLDLYQALLDSGELTVRVHMSRLILPSMDVKDYVESTKAISEKYNGKYIRANFAKMFMDGVMEVHTAAMLEPYSDNTSQAGSTDWPQKDFNITVAKLDEEGLQIICHSVGDKGVRWNLDGYEYAQKVNGKKDSRHAVTHIECIHPQDIPRFKKLGVICNMQPQHASAEEVGRGGWVTAVGTERIKYAWPWNSLDEAGGKLAFGSDWPVVTLNPVTGIYTAVTGRSPALPEQHLSLEKTIEAYTINGAYSSFEENIKGSVKEGKLADMVILSRNLFSIPRKEIKDAKVLMTIFGGKVVYEDKEF